MAADPTNTAIRRYFAGLAENTFQARLGVVDPPLIDYLSDLLIRFVRADVVHGIRGVTGRPLMTITEMAAEARQRLGDASRQLHRHIGDFTLFWAGVYPEALRRRGHDPDDQFESYCSHGKRAYLIASTIQSDQDVEVPASTFERLSESFELCAYGLREVRREWESGDDTDDGPLWILLN
jgi:hypothetical protein